MLKAGEWEAFLAVHPELTGHDFTRRELLRALRRALREHKWLEIRQVRGYPIPPGVASSSSVAWQLCPMPSRRLVGKVARELSGLADEGRVTKLRPPRWSGESLRWTLPGVEIAPRLAKRLTVEVSDAR